MKSNMDKQILQERVVSHPHCYYSIPTRCEECIVMDGISPVFCLIEKQSESNDVSMQVYHFIALIESLTHVFYHPRRSKQHVHILILSNPDFPQWEESGLLHSA